MDQKVRKRLRAIKMLAKGDDTYYAMLQKLRVREKQYNSVLCALSHAQQDGICDFFCMRK